MEIGPDGTTTSTSQYLIHPPGLGAAKEFLKRAITKHASSLAAHMVPDAEGMADLSALQQSAEGQHVDAAAAAAVGVPGTTTAVADPAAAASAAAATADASAEQVRHCRRAGWFCQPTIMCHGDWHKCSPAMCACISRRLGKASAIM